MANELIENIAAQFSDVDKRLQLAEEMIKLAKDAGEDMVKAETTLREQKVKTDRWKRALQANGYTPSTGG